MTARPTSSATTPSVSSCRTSAATSVLLATISAQGQNNDRRALDRQCRRERWCSRARSPPPAIASRPRRADPSKLDADDLLQGGPAVSIEGNVAQGHHPCRSAQGQQHDRHGRGRRRHRGFARKARPPIVSYGAAPAMRIGSAGRHHHRCDRGNRHRLRPDRRRRHRGRRPLHRASTAMRLQIGGTGRHRVHRQRHRRRPARIKAKSLDRTRRPSASAPARPRRSCAMPARSWRAAATPPRRPPRLSTLPRAPACRSCATAGRSSASTGANGTAIAIIDRSGSLEPDRE